jgi:hypothetical protein
MDNRRDGNWLNRIGRLPFPAMFAVTALLTTVVVVVLTAIILAALNLAGA